MLQQRNLFWDAGSLCQDWCVKLTEFSLISIFKFIVTDALC